MKSRILVIFVGLGIVWGSLFLRGGQLFFLPKQKIQERQQRLFQTRVKLEARRGAIVDRKGRDLALSIKGFGLSADPSQIEAPRWVSRKISPVVGLPSEQIFRKIRDRNRQFVWIARSLDTEKKEKLAAMGIKGLNFSEEYRRVYPNDNLLASTLGMVGGDGQGLEGIEKSMDLSLKGEARKIEMRRDARGRPLLEDALAYSLLPEGEQLMLTIDSEIQNVLEKELSDTIKEFDATQAFGVILEVESGEVVALASSPGFDANKAFSVAADKRRNRVVTDVFEPGSVIKTFAIAAAIEEKQVQPSTRIDTEHGKMKVGNRIIREAEATHNWASLTVSEILAFSSNVGTSKIAMKLGDQKLREYFEKFGFGKKTGIELTGEARGALLPLPWPDHLLSNISFGQGISATPLQVAAAYLTIASGGIWRAPHLIKSQPIERRVLSPETALAVRLMLVAATDKKGTGENARVEGFLVGGKTGTAQMVNPVARGYIDGAYISSFAGFLPATEPKYVIYVSVDHAKKNSYYGSHVAAPVFSRIASYMARLEGWAPSNLSERSLPLAAHAVRKPAVIENRSYSKSIPDLTNLTVREVLRDIQSQSIQVRVVGSGVVHETWPRAGAPWSKKKSLTLFLKPQLAPRKFIEIQENPASLESKSSQETISGVELLKTE